MKRWLILSVLVMVAWLLSAQYIVNFEGTGEVKAAYASGTVSLSGMNWDMTEALIGLDAADWKNGLRSARLRGYGTTALTMLENKSNGAGTVSMYYRRYGTDAQVDWKVEYSTDNGVNWLQLGSSFTAPASDTPQLFSETVNLSGSIRIRIKRATESGTTNKRLNIDDITITDYVPAEPAIVLNPNTLSGFTYELGEGPSASQSYLLSAMNLSPSSGNITISGSTNYDVSLDNGSFGAITYLPYSGGAVSSATLYVRLKAGLGVGSFNGENINHSGGGASALLGVSGSVTTSSVGLTGGGYTQDFSSYVSLATLPDGWTLSDTYTYQGDFGTGTIGGLRGNGTFGMQLTASAPNNNLTATLNLVNQTGTTISNLNVSYMGEVARTDQTGTPKWVVTVNGTVIPELEYSTADGINALRSAVVAGLNVAPGGLITITWFTTSTGTSGTRRQIGITDLDINTTFVGNPVINVSGNPYPFGTTLGTPSATQSYTLSGTELNDDIVIAVPNGFEISSDGGSSYQSGTVNLPSSFNGTVLIRMTGANVGTFGGNIEHSSTGAVSVNLAVVGTVSGASSYATDLFFSEYIEGASYNKAIEIFNGTGVDVNLSDYKVEIYVNSSPTASNFLNLSDTLAHGEVLVIANSGANAAILAQTDITNNFVANFNGNDALAIRRISTGELVDLFGVIGSDPGTAWTGEGGYSTLNKTLVRKGDVYQGITTNPEGTGATAFTTLTTEWDLYAQDYTDDLGMHTFNAIIEEVVAPTQQASNIITYPANTEMTLEWTPGNGTRRIVKINTANSFTPPTDSSNPSANSVYSGAGEQVIFNGATQIIESSPFNGCSVSNLNPNTTYWFRVYEYNGTGANTKFNTSTATDNPKSGTTTNSQSSGYYAGITGYGTTLKSNLHTLLRTTHITQYSYDALWTQIPYTDEDPNNSSNIIEIYTGWSVPKTHYGTGTTEWNREHTWSQSHGDLGTSRPGGTDLHHMRPCDVTVNSAKSDKDFDSGGTLYTDASPYTGYSGDTGCYTSTNTWEPRDADKGDVARMIMYMAVRYEGTDTSYNLEVVDLTNTSGANYGKLSTLLNWHVQDPPDAREHQRNNRIYERQGNRNPFIDNPLYASYVWAPVPTNATSVTQTSFTANWTVPISATKYFLQVATDSLFQSFVSGYSNYDAALATSKAIAGLSNTNTYYYRLRSYFASGYSMYSPFLAVSLLAPTASAVITPGYTLNEYNLSGAHLLLTLSNTSFADATLLIPNFTVNNAPSGLTIQGIQYLSATMAQITLGFDGTDFDTNVANLSVTINAIELSTASQLTSSAIGITAYVETPCQVSIAGSVLTLQITTVPGAVTYKVFAADNPYTGFADASATGAFDPQYPYVWNQTLGTDPRRFYFTVGIRN